MSENDILDVEVKIKNTIIVKEEEEEKPRVRKRSSLNLSVFDRLAINFGSAIVSIFVLGIGLPMAMTIKQKYLLDRTKYSNEQLQFKGNYVDLFISYIKWIILTIITLGVYGFWIERNILRWKAENTVLEKDPDNPNSFWMGSAGKLFVVNLLKFLMIIFTAGIATPWANVYKERYVINHTVIAGKRLIFRGRGTGLFLQQFKWVLLTFATLGVYFFWLRLKVAQWKVRHTFIHERGPDYTRPEDIPFKERAAMFYAKMKQSQKDIGYDDDEGDYDDEAPPRIKERKPGTVPLRRKEQGYYEADADLDDFDEEDDYDYEDERKPRTYVRKPKPKREPKPKRQRDKGRPNENFAIIANILSLLVMGAMSMTHSLLSKLSYSAGLALAISFFLLAIGAIVVHIVNIAQTRGTITPKHKIKHKFFLLYYLNLFALMFALFFIVFPFAGVPFYTIFLIISIVVLVLNIVFIIVGFTKKGFAVEAGLLIGYTVFLLLSWLLPLILNAV